MQTILYWLFQSEATQKYCCFLLAFRSSGRHLFLSQRKHSGLSSKNMQVQLHCMQCCASKSISKQSIPQQACTSDFQAVSCKSGFSLLSARADYFCSQHWTAHSVSVRMDISSVQILTIWHWLGWYWMCEYVSCKSGFSLLSARADYFCSQHWTAHSASVHMDISSVQRFTIWHWLGW